MSVIYDHYHLKNRLDLWKDLKSMAQSIKVPWLVIGDFNNVLKPDGRLGGNRVKDSKF